MLDLEWVLNSLKEARDDESWDLIREVIAYLEEDDLFEIYKQDEDWFRGADD
tara:strand:- start:62 stop:217 length:156 start_codon:yes stop_codon:yes gene_type:complete